MLAAGTRLGAYEIVGLLGAGGMGEVYRARDPRLGRDVALKVLPDVFAGDAGRLARFQREAHVLASLKHANIGAIYGLEEVSITDVGAGSSRPVRALVLELIEGETLADRIARGAIPMEEALPIARQIAEALEAAQEQGIIHRDLKPANIKITPEGVVKVLDFGLAKLGAADPSAASGPSALAALSMSPTMSTPAATAMGIILGTAAYMSPEQARGTAVDKRTDIWAFGCVLYEMLSGKRAFDGEDVTDVLSRVLQRDPDLDALPANTPSAIHRLLRRCLAKDRRQRLSDAAAVRLEIEDASAAPADAAAALLAPQAHTLRRTIGLTIGAALIAALITGLAAWLALGPAPPRVTRTTVTPPATARLAIDGVTRDLAIAPDGARIVYVVANGTQLGVRALDQLAPTTISGVTPRHPFFSPDGQWIGFFDNDSLKKVPTNGGPAVTLSRVSDASRGASWGPDDSIIFATADPSIGLLRVEAAGGEPEVLTTPDQTQGEVDHLWPEVVAEGVAVLFTIATTRDTEQAQVGLLNLRTRERRVLLRRGSHAQYIAPGYLIYAVAGTLWAVAFDSRRLEVVGEPVPVVEGVVTTPLGAVDVSVSGNGTLVYVPDGQARTQRTLVWVDRQGAEEAIAAPPRAYVLPRLSPDGTKVALDVRDQELDISIWDLTRATLTRLTFDPGFDRFPVWTPDGRRIAFSSDQGGVANVFWQAADGSGAVERLSESPDAQFANSFTPDGTRLVVSRQNAPGSGTDLSLLMLNEDRRAVPLLQTRFDEQNGEVSPDGRWLAYESNEPGLAQIYVRPFPAVNQGRWQVSTGGGTEPLWARDGRELFYRAPDGTLMGVAVTAQGATSFMWGTPAKLVEGQYFAGGGVYSGRTYDASPDGKRFLMIKEGSGADETAASPSIVVVQNWTEELKRLVPVD